MRTESQRYLDDVVQASAAIGEFCSGKSFAVYTSSILMRSAVERKVGIVAEALLQLEVVDAETFARIPDARQIASLRDYLVEGYAQIENDKIWAFAQSDLLELTATITKLLAGDSARS